MKAGTTFRYDCSDCATEFEVTLEPKAKGTDGSNVADDDKGITCCPFCGSLSGVTSEDDPDMESDQEEDDEDE